MSKNEKSREYRIPFNKPFVAGRELYYISRAVHENRHLSGDGPFTKKCEEWLEQTLNCRKAFLTTSCTAALEMTALLTNLKPGDEVIMPSFTFVSTANAMAMRGAVPVFIDIRPDTLNIDETLIEHAITSRTRGIVPVHYAGAPCAMDKILSIARAHGLWVTEDAAQAMMSTYDGKYLGTLGDFGCLSFHETKNVISGEGGALLINSDEYIERAEILREKGTNRSRFFRGEVDKYTWVDVGSSFLPSELVSAFLYAQLERAQEIIRVRCKLVDRYRELLGPLAADGRIVLPPAAKDWSCNGHLFYIMTESLDVRSRLIRWLKERGILAVFHYVPLHSSEGGRRLGRSASPMSITDDVSERLLRLPLYYDLTNEEQQAVVRSVYDFYAAESSAKKFKAV
jgi:dTDP-4-amino-4,6-dideoxygalactose transaminase